MPQYDDNPIVENLKKYPKYFNDPENAWDNFKADFIRKTPDERVTDLFTVDAWMAPHDRVSHQTASLLNAKRELDDIHQAMRKAGR
jgi:hypothetical protein